MKKVIFIFMFILFFLSSCDNLIENTIIEDDFIDEIVEDIIESNDENIEIYNAFFEEDKVFFVEIYYKDNGNEHGYFIFDERLSDKSKQIYDEGKSYYDLTRINYESCKIGSFYSQDYFMEHSYEADNKVDHTIKLLFEGNFIKGPFDWKNGFVCIEFVDDLYNIVALNALDGSKTVIYQHDEEIDAVSFNDELLFFASQNILYRYHVESKIVDMYYLRDDFVKGIKISSILRPMSSHVVSLYGYNPVWLKVMEKNGNSMDMTTDECKNWLINQYNFKEEWFESTLEMAWQLSGNSIWSINYYDFRANLLTAKAPENVLEKIYEIYPPEEYVRISPDTYIEEIIDED